MMLSALIKTKFSFDFNEVCVYKQYGAAFMGTSFGSLLILLCWFSVAQISD
jgi:hypothetical protein